MQHTLLFTTSFELTLFTAISMETEHEIGIYFSWMLELIFSC